MSTQTDSLNGRQLIGYSEQDGSPSDLHGVEPDTGNHLPGSFSSATLQQVNEACRLASATAPKLAAVSLEKRAGFLQAVAEELLAARAALTSRGHAETALPLPRLEGELSRTAGQMSLFAGVLRKGLFIQAAIDSADAARKPLPKPSLATLQVPLGPIVVFAASNFPLAYSAAGGDVASALAAGCPVIVRAHPAHPGTAELAACAVLRAAQRTGMPEGVYSLLTGPGNNLGAQLVQHPAVCGVGFTGSRAGGLALAALAAARPVPIPFFAEMSSVNPVFLLPAALAERGSTIAEGLVASVLQGVGQFCTSPGLTFGVAGDAWRTFVQTATQAMQHAPSATMLHAGIASAYAENAEALAALPAVSVIARGGAAGHCQAQPQLCHTTAEAFLREPRIAAEVFGPSSLLVECASLEQMLAAAAHLEGQLTASVHLSAADHDDVRRLLPVLSSRVGRVIANGFPTGLEVGHATVHGGPYPATTDSRWTAVGSRAIERWLRPVCFQGFPDELLPAALQEANPLQLPRTIDGELRSR